MGNIDRAIKFYKSGLGIKKVSEKVDIPRETLRLILKEKGVKLRKSKKYILALHQPLYTISPKSAELLAMHAGDGCLDRTGRWCFTADIRDEFLAKHVINLVKEIVGIVPSIFKDKRRVQIRSSQKQIRKYFLKYYSMGKKAYGVRLPSVIISTKNKDIKCHALRGLFSTDGSFSFKKKELTPRIEFRVKSKKLRDQFVKLAKGFDFKFNYNTQKHRNGIIYTAYIEKIQEVIRWFGVVGSSCDIHIKRYNNWYKLIKRRGSRAWSKLAKQVD